MSWLDTIQSTVIFFVSLHITKKTTSPYYSTNTMYGRMDGVVQGLIQGDDDGCKFSRHHLTSEKKRTYIEIQHIVLAFILLQLGKRVRLCRRATRRDASCLSFFLSLSLFLSLPASVSLPGAKCTGVANAIEIID